MKWYGWVILIVVSVLVGVGAFALARGSFGAHGAAGGTWGMHGGQGHHGMQPLTQWLETSTTQEVGLNTADPKFSDEARPLAQAVQSERLKLLDLLGDAKSTDDQINAQSEKVLAAEAALQRRVTQYVLKARSVLSVPQQQRLLGLYGQGMGCGYQGGRTDDSMAGNSEHTGGMHGMGHQGNGMDSGHHGGH